MFKTSNLMGWQSCLAHPKCIEPCSGIVGCVCEGRHLILINSFYFGTCIFQTCILFIATTKLNMNMMNLL